MYEIIEKLEEVLASLNYWRCKKPDEWVMSAYITELGSVKAVIPQWKPIETAPKTGVAILTSTVYPDGSLDTDINYWHAGREEWGSHLDPTHWMPLPPLPPSTTTTKESV